MHQQPSYPPTPFILAVPEANNPEVVSALVAQ